ncbi:hypothetical protein MASSI9I_20893 [Massilia sp. 9I]|nr:hypothetical protein MASSI9I_20893 [Massilia sp. 9I]
MTESRQKTALDQNFVRTIEFSMHILMCLKYTNFTAYKADS